MRLPDLSNSLPIVYLEKIISNNCVCSWSHLTFRNGQVYEAKLDNLSLVELLSYVSFPSDFLFKILVWGRTCPGQNDQM